MPSKTPLGNSTAARGSLASGDTSPKRHAAPPTLPGQWEGNIRMAQHHRRRGPRLLVVISLSAAALAALGILWSDHLRAFTAQVLESPADVKHRKAVLAARRGEYDEALRLFEQVLGSDARPEAWIDYVRALSWAQRNDAILRAFPRMPPGVRGHPEVLEAVARASLATGNHEVLVDTLARLLAEVSPSSAQPFRDTCASAQIAPALHLLADGFRQTPEKGRWAQRLLVESVRQNAVARARAGDLRAALPALEALEEAAPSPEVLADFLVVLSWAGRNEKALELFASSPTAPDLPEYALSAMVRAWQSANQERLPANFLARALLAMGDHPELAAGLVDGCRSSRILGTTRNLLIQTSRDAGPAADTIRARVDYRLAVLLARESRHDTALALLTPLLERDLPFAAAMHADYMTILSWAGRHAEAVRAAARHRGEAPLPDYAVQALQRSEAALEQQRQRRADQDYQRGIALARAGRFDEALRTLERARRGPDALAPAMDRAVILAWAGRAADAVHSFEALPADAAKPAYVLSTVAGAYRALGKPDPAIALWRAALLQQPEDAAALEGLLATLVEADRFDEARALLESSRHCGPHCAVYRARLDQREAVTRARHGDTDRGLAMLDKAAAAAPGDEAIAWDRIVVLGWAGKSWECNEAWEALKKPANAPAYVRREVAEAYADTHRSRAALALLAGLLAEAPDDARAAARIASVLLDNRRHLLEPGLTRFARREANVPIWLREYAWADPGFANAFAAARSGDEAGALRELRRALEHPSSTPALLADALVLLHLARHDAEVGALSRAVPAERTGAEWRAVTAAFASLGDENAALGAAHRWCERRPADADACPAVALRLLALGDWEQALVFARKLPAGDRARLEAEVRLQRGDRDMAARFFTAHLDAQPDDAQAMFGLALTSELQGQPPEADAFAARALARIEPEDFLALRSLGPDARLGLARVLRRAGRPADSAWLLAPLAAAHPEMVAVRSELAQSLEAQRERLPALAEYDAVLERAPDDAQAAARRAQLLLKLQALDPIAADVPAAVAQSATRAIAQMRAVQDWTFKRVEGSSPIASANGTGAGFDADEASLSRTTIAQLDRAEDANLEYETTLLASAEAHAALGEHARALERYDKLLELIDARGGRDSPAYGAARLEQERCLTKLLRFDEAGAILDELDRTVPAVRTYRGVRVPNWQKVELAAERGWWLVAQDRLEDADQHFAKMVQAAPRSSEARFGLAHTHLMRGWSRKGLAEFREAVALHPGDTELQAGLAHALLLNGRQAEAQQIAQTLLAEAPTNPNVRELGSELRLTSAPELSATTAVDSGRARADGIEAEARLRVPVAQQALALYGGAGWKREGGRAGSAERRRAVVGAQAVPLEGFSLRGEGSSDPIARSWRAAGELLLSPGDGVGLGLSADSDSWELPPGALRAGVTARQFGASARYQPNEKLEAELRGTLLVLSDGNRIQGGLARTQLQLFANGLWRAGLGLELSLDHSNLKDRAYYSPALLLATSLVPSLEHVWTWRAGYELRDRIVADAGVDRESGFGLAGRWGIEYQQKHVFKDIAEVHLELGLTRRRYGEESELGWHVGFGSGVWF